MNRFILTSLLFFALIFCVSGQNVGVGTTSPQAKLHVNGTFKLQNGTTVNGISNDTTFTPGSDSLLVTQLAVKRYAQNSDRFMLFQEMDSTFQGNQTVAMYPDSMMYSSPDGWQSDSALNVFTTQGNVGLGVSNPATKLIIYGDQKIEGSHTLTLGSGTPEWETNAPKIGYGTLTPNALDIVGGGPVGNKKINLWYDTWVLLYGKSSIADTATFSSGIFRNFVRSDDNIGIGVANSDHELNVNGSVRVSGGHLGGRIGILGSMGAFNLRCMREGNCWGNSYGPAFFGMGMLRIGQSADVFDVATSYYGNNDPVPNGMSVRGNIMVTDSLVVQQITNVNQTLKVAGVQTIELGAFIPGKEINAGKIGYQTFTSNALDIVGGGNSPTTRKIKLWAPGKVITNGNVTINGALEVTAIKNESWTELGASLQNNWVNYGDGYSTIAMYKDNTGVVHIRGLIKNGLNQQNTIIVNLPAGYRPVSGHQLFEVINGVDTFGRIDVETDGDIVFRGTTNTFISLDQIVFKTN